ncbi:MAG: hypothetical protein ACOYZ8_04980 [Chloroflexota bacterium]
MADWKVQIEEELARAERARARNNEGQARVCARRAAGLAAREYLEQTGAPVRTNSAYELLKLLADQPRLAPDLRRAAVHLTLRVTEEFKLPVEVDLIVEAKKLCNGLFPE